MDTVPIEAQRREKFGGIQAGRAVAAILVVFAHAGTIIAEPRFYGAEPFGGLLRQFGVGVDFFFVLSGFIIAWVHWGDIGRRERLPTYARNRFLRIYPPYWGVLLPLSFLYFLFPNAGIPSQHDPVNFVFSFLLAPYTKPPIHSVAWTLVHEMIFYVIFGLLIRLGARAVWILPIWALGILAVYPVLDSLPFPLTVLLNPYNLEFLIGIGTALTLMHIRVRVPELVAVVGSIFFLSAMLFGAQLLDHQLAARLVFGSAAALFILGIVERERSRGLAVPPFVLLLGAASYAIYLIHGLALSAVVHVTVLATGRTLPIVAVLVLLVVAATLTGVVYHLVYEKPVSRRLRVLFASEAR
ncbi:acyltransferase [Methylobacterium sp. J-088]|uniref:acyltransferase family protein n=1 Tax=Methylobacterium sp. J-088 TaxID=2836664 RepID=UPI001FBAE5D7|nr:acyltransferase [Methylobacterium sp. J-088]MCJ2064898.1 acyltransferase [Methylobacterium sp. J-088]